MLLFRCQGMDPGKQQRTDQIEFMCGDLFFRPLVIFNRAHHKFDFIRRFEMLQIFPVIPFAFPAARAFEIHDSAHAGINLRNIMRAARFEQDGEPIIANRFHERD